MSKNIYSNSIEASLEGRNIENATDEKQKSKGVSKSRRQASENIKNENKPLIKAAIDSDTSPKKTTSKSKAKKSNAGRKKIADEDKRRNFSLSLSPRTIERLEEKVKGKPRNATFYVAQYIEENLDEFLNNL